MRRAYLKVNMKLPKHNISLFLEHNEHKLYHQSLEDYLECNEYDWPSDSEKELAIKIDSLWTIQWYPDSTVGFYRVAAASLETLLESIKEYC